MTTQHDSSELPESVRHLLFYDGDCALCSRTVRLTARADRRGHFAFAPLGGETAQRESDALEGFGSNLDSLILLEDVGPSARMYRRSRAVLRTLWRLGFPWSVPGVLAFLPPWPLDLVYRGVARTRFALFGRARECPVPPRGTERRFLP